MDAVSALVGNCWPALLVMGGLAACLLFWRGRDPEGTMAPQWGTAAAVFIIIVGVVFAILAFKGVLDSPQSWGLNPATGRGKEMLDMFGR